MNIQGFFVPQTHPSDIYDIEGQLRCTEKVHYTRQGISNNDFAHTHKYKGLLEGTTQMQEGDLVVDKTDNSTYLCMAMRLTYYSNQANLWKCDSECSLYHLANTYEGNKITGKQMVRIKEDIPCVQKDTNGRIKFFDASLLESTIKLVYMQYTPYVKIADRLLIDGNGYQIDSIDAASVKNVLILQLSEDKRKFENVVIENDALLDKYTILDAGGA